MTHERHIGPEEWTRLEALWDTVSVLPPHERDGFLASRGVDGALREELESLLARADTAETFFDRLLTVVPHGGGDDTAVHSCAPHSDPLLGTTVAHYEIVERLGHGGMGVVYRAVDLRLQRTVALKLLRRRAHDDARAKKRLLIEARAAAALDHPNICTIYEVGETGGTEQQSFIAMAFYEGETLEQLLRRGRVAPSLALDYASQIARGLAAAHERGIVHRDVKPGNIMIAANGVVKLLDFGVARILDVDASHENVTPGTIAYMAPEQVTSRAVDPRADLWALGVVLYEMCTGARPFRGEHAAAVLYAILNDSPAPVSSVCSDVPRHLERVVERLLEKDPEQRYRDAEALLVDLAPSSSGLRSERRLASAIGRLPKRWRRHAAWYGAAALGIVALIAAWPVATSSTSSDRRIAAQDLYDQGQRDVLFRTASGRRQARDLFRQAVAVDSTYAPAHAALAHLLVMTAEDTGASHRDAVVEAEQIARRAIALDSSLADAHAALGHALFFDYQFAEAEKQFRRAVDLDPMQPYVREFLVWLYVFTERPREALEQANQSRADNPNSPTAIAEVARALLLNGRCDEALALLGRLTYLQPPPARAATIAAQCYARRAMWQRAIDEVRPVAQRNPLMAEPWLGFMLARAGQTDEAQRIRDRLIDLWRRDGGGAYGVAVVHAGFGDLDRAFEWLEKAIDDRSLRYNIMEPAFDELRRDPRFDRVRQRLGIQKRHG
jgi:serine/threonine-protein kinase